MKLIVYVDGDDEDFFLFKKAINEISANYTVLRIDSPGNLFELITVLRPDFIFLDISGPLSNGVECLQTIRSEEEFNETPVIIYSSVKDHVEISSYNKANYFLVKPDSFLKILSALNTILSFNWQQDFYPAKETLNDLLV